MIHRIEKGDNFTVISNDLIRNQDLSDGAFRLLIYLLSCSDDWDFNVKGISTCLGISAGAVSSRLKELQEAGFVTIKKYRTEKGKISSWTWEIFEQPHSEILNVGYPHSNNLKVEPHSDYPHSANPHSVNPDVENLNGKEILIERNTNSKEIPKERNIFRKPNFEEVQAYCLERNNGIDPEQFIDYYESKGWVVGKSKMKDWKACVRTWERNRKGKPTAIKPNPVPEESPFKKLLREEGYSI